MINFLKKTLRWLAIGGCMLAFGLFIDWLIINMLTDCCEGGICVPEWLYPQCVNHQQGNEK